MSDELLPPPLEDDRVAMMLGLVPDKRTPEQRLLHAVQTGGESLKYRYIEPEVLEEFAQQLYENEPPTPSQPWANLSETTHEHYRQYARNVITARL